MAYKLICLLGIFGVSFSSLFAQITFNKVYSGNGLDKGYGVTQLPDSGYAVTGITSSLFEGPSQVLLLRTDSLGNFLWSRSFGGDNSEWGRRIFNAGNDFIIAGNSNSFSEFADFDFYLLRITSQGELIWQHTFGTSDWERLWDAVMLPDGGLIMVGETVGISSLEEDIYLVRTDENGDLIWEKTIQTTSKDVAYSCALLTDTTFLIGGISSNEENSATGYLARIHINGTILNEYYLGSNGTGEFYDLDVYNNEIYAVGSIDLGTGNLKDHWMIRATTEASILYESIDSRPENDWVSTIAIRDPMSMYITAWTETTDFDLYPDGPDLLFVKYANQFYWNGVSAFFSNPGPDECHQMIISHDGGPVMVGFAMSTYWTQGGSGVTLIKVGPNDQLTPEPDITQGILNISSNVENSLNSFHVYPNPFTDELQIIRAEQNSEAYSLFLSDQQGRIIQSLENEEKINTQELTSGMYFIQIIQSGHTAVFKLMKN